MSSTLDSSGGLVQWPSNLPTPINSPVYTVDPRNMVTMMESNRNRVRRDFLEPLSVFDVTWNFTEEQYSIFQDFFVNKLNSGVNFFQLETFDLTETPGVVNRVVRSVAFLDGTYSHQESDNCFTVGATLIVDEEAVYESNPDIGLPGQDTPKEPIITTEVTYSDCLDEITISWTGLPVYTGPSGLPGSGVRNASIWHGATDTGPWLWWGETRVGVSKVILGNYFGGTRWLKVVAESESGTAVVALFKPMAPMVNPPFVQLNEYPLPSGTHTPVTTANIPNDYEPVLDIPAGLPGHRTSSTHSDGFWQLPYGGGYTGLDYVYDPEGLNITVPDAARDRTAAVNQVLIDNESAYKISLYRHDGTAAADLPSFEHDQIAFVELQWRYTPYFFNAPEDTTGYVMEVILSSNQDGVTFKWTQDGSNPTLTNGKNSGDRFWPSPSSRSQYVPYLIVRAFKDECHSAPVYVPVDIVCPQLTRCTNVPSGATGNSSMACAQWYWNETDCTLHLSSPGFGSPGIVPCNIDPNTLQEGADSNAMAHAVSTSPVRVVLTYTYSSSFDTTLPANYFGPNPGCTGPLGGDSPLNGPVFGGGVWRGLTNLSFAQMTTWAWVYDGYPFAFSPVDALAFYLLSGDFIHSGLVDGVEVTSAPDRFPNDAEQNIRHQLNHLYDPVSGLGSPGSGVAGTGNNLVTELVGSTAISNPYIYSSPNRDNSYAELVGMFITITCASL